MTWETTQNRLRSAMEDRESFAPPVAGRFRPGRGTMPPDHPFLRVIAKGRHRKTHQVHFLLQLGGSGASWWPDDAVELLPKELSP